MSVRTECNRPVRKVWAGGISGAATTLVFYIINTHIAPDKPIPPEVATALLTLLSFLVSYITSPGKDEGLLNTKSEEMKAKLARV
jgi:hypothetical protein